MRACLVWAERSTPDRFWVPSHLFAFFDPYHSFYEYDRLGKIWALMLHGGIPKPGKSFDFSVHMLGFLVGIPCMDKRLLRDKVDDGQMASLNRCLLRGCSDETEANICQLPLGQVEAHLTSMFKVKQSQKASLFIQTIIRLSLK